MSDFPSRRRSPSRRWVQVSKLWSSAALPLASLTAAGLLAVSFSGSSPVVSGGVVHASQRSYPDPDNDGLNNAQESILGTSPLKVDSDGDGFSDLEEVSRNSDPTLPTSIPLPANLDLGMSARGEAGENRILIALYLGDGNEQNKELHVGVAVAGHQFLLDPEDYSEGSTLRLIPARAPTAKVLVFDFPLDLQLVHTFGCLSVFATVNLTGDPQVLAAEAVDFAGVDGVPCLNVLTSRQRVARFAPLGAVSGGSIYTPIPPNGDGSIPLTWAPGEICYQTSAPVAAFNGIIVHEVIDAECISDWDGYCRSACTSSVGTTYEPFDPPGLVGG